ncbi:hypothetical protein [Microbacterium jiangjiandongii]|uniref:hypothetical protein n=1 Tax=Microbacterium jiangjiandongii TaxID=3049071 RepID=UPI00214CDFFF|nr:hypothetical protein [Microbacterium sp. zg.Y843]MCR2816485.1 hypothetical protein [Microbacterium sp. zg.Y843]
MSVANVDLADGELLMDDVGELIYRQITEHMMDGDQVASAAFGPYPVDNGMPSYSRSSVVDAQEARDWHNLYATSASLSVWAVSVGEVVETDRPTIDDSGTPVPAGKSRAPGHCYIDFRGLQPAMRKSVRGQLWFFAMDRGEIPTDEPARDGELFA